MSLMSFPRKEADLLQWSKNFLDHIQADAAAYNLAPQDVTEYQTIHETFSSALTACDPAVRSKVAVTAKDAALEELKSTANRLKCKVYSSPSVTVAQKVELGIPPRARPTIVPPPAAAPVIQLISIMGRTATIRLRDADGARRGKPKATAGASIFSYAGQTPPADLRQWKFEGSVGRVEKIPIQFPSTLAPVTMVWVTAFWFNAKKERGPISQAIAMNLPGGNVQIAT